MDSPSASPRNDAMKQYSVLLKVQNNLKESLKKYEPTGASKSDSFSLLPNTVLPSIYDKYKDQARELHTSLSNKSGSDSDYSSKDKLNNTVANLSTPRIYKKWNVKKKTSETKVSSFGNEKKNQLRKVTFKSFCIEDSMCSLNSEEEKIILNPLTPKLKNKLSPSKTINNKKEELKTHKESNVSFSKNKSIGISESNVLLISESKTSVGSVRANIVNNYTKTSFEDEKIEEEKKMLPQKIKIQEERLLPQLNLTPNHKKADILENRRKYNSVLRKYRKKDENGVQNLNRSVSPILQVYDQKFIDDIIKSPTFSQVLHKLNIYDNRVNDKKLVSDIKKNYIRNRESMNMSALSKHTDTFENSFNASNKLATIFDEINKYSSIKSKKGLLKHQKKETVAVNEENIKEILHVIKNIREYSSIQSREGRAFNDILEDREYNIKQNNNNFLNKADLLKFKEENDKRTIEMKYLVGKPTSWKTKSKPISKVIEKLCPNLK